MQMAIRPKRRAFRDNYLAAILGAAVLLLTAASGYAQIYTPATNYGAANKRGSFDSTLFFPTGCGIPTDATWLFSEGFNHQGEKKLKFALYGDSCGNKAYLWIPSLQAWQPIGHGAGIDTLYSRSDSAFYIKDSIEHFAFLLGTGGSTVHVLTPITGDGSSGSPLGLTNWGGSGPLKVYGYDASSVLGFLTLGTAAFIDKPVSGNATSAQAVLGSDTRLADSRTPAGTNVVPNTMLAQMPANTIKGNNTGSTANAADLTAAQVTAILNLFTTSNKGLVPAPSAVNGYFLGDDGNWHAGGGGGGSAAGPSKSVQIKSPTSGTFGNVPNFTADSTTATVNADTLTAHKVRADSLKLNLSTAANRGFGGATKYFTVGNSITVGLNASVFDSSYVACNGRLFGLPVVDSGVSSTLTPAIASMSLRNISYPNTYVTSIMGGFNNARATNMINNRASVNNVINSYKAVWWNQFSTGVQNATSGTGVTRTGTWTTAYNSIINAGGKTAGAAYTSSAGAYLEWTFTDSTAAALLEIGSTSATSVTFSIDGTTLQTLNLSGKFDGNGAYLGVTFGLYPVILTGLTYGAHTLRITNVSGGLFIVDCLSNLVPSNSANAMALIFYHAPYQNAAGYAANAGTPYSNAAADTLNSKIDSLAAALPSAWPLYVAKTNLRYNVTTGISGDNIHPNNTGHKQISLAAADGVNGPPPSPGVIFAQYNPDGSFNGFYAQSEKTGQKNKIAFTTSNGLQDVIINNPSMSADNFINVNNFNFTIGNAQSAKIDSTKFVPGYIYHQGVIKASSSAAAISWANRTDTTQSWQWVGTTAHSTDLFSSDGGTTKSVIRIDTAGRFMILGRGGVTPLTSYLTLPLGQSAAGYSPIKFASPSTAGLLITAEVGAVEMQNSRLYVTGADGIRHWVQWGDSLTNTARTWTAGQDMTGTTLTVATPSASNQAAPKSYVDAAIGTSGISFPTIVNSSNAASITSDSAVWGQSAQSVWVDGHFTVTPTSGSVNTIVNVGIPVNSLLTGGHAAWGQVSTSQTVNGFLTGAISSGSPGSNQVTLTVAPTGGTSAFSIYYHYSYRIQ